MNRTQTPRFGYVIEKKNSVINWISVKSVVWKEVFTNSEKLKCSFASLLMHKNVHYFLSIIFEVSSFLEYFSINHIARSLSRFSDMVLRIIFDELQFWKWSFECRNSHWQRQRPTCGAVQTSLSVDDRA